MADSSRRAVLTGLGLVTPVGLGPGPFWDALSTGRSGVHRLQAYDPAGLPTQFGGEVVGFDIKDHLDKKDRKRVGPMVRSVHLAAVAAQLGLRDGRLDTAALDPTRFGVLFGSATVPSDMDELGPAGQASYDPATDTIDVRKWGAAGMELIPPMWMLNHVPNMMACLVSILHNAQGPNNTIIMTDVAGLMALGEAYRTIGRDRADVFLVGGADTMLSPISLVRQTLFRQLSRRNDAPEKASRPFDRARDGLVPGEGAGVLVLEEREHARRRGAPIYAEVVGFGAAFDRDCAGPGLARAVRLALAEARLAPGDIDHVSAQGLSTVAGDAWEARGLHEVFGACRPAVPVFAAKSYFGHLGAGSCLVELAASLLALQHGLVPATLNHEDPDPACPVVVPRVPRPATRPYFLKVAFTEMGQCAAVVCRKGE